VLDDGSDLSGRKVRTPLRFGGGSKQWLTATLWESDFPGTDSATENIPLGFASVRLSKVENVR